MHSNPKDGPVEVAPVSPLNSAESMNTGVTEKLLHWMDSAPDEFLEVEATWATTLKEHGLHFE